MSNIIRKAKNKENPYVMISKAMLNDNNISWKAKGLLSYLLSKPDDWKVQVTDLIKQSTDGRDAVYSILKELIKIGYIERNRLIDKNTKRVMGWEYIVYENPLTDIPHVATPQMDSPHMENPDITNSDPTNNDFNNNEVTNKEEEEEEALVDILSTYKKYIGELNQYVTDELPGWLNKLTHKEITFAIKQAAKHNAKSYAYLETVLVDYHSPLSFLLPLNLCSLIFSLQ